MKMKTFHNSEHLLRRTGNKFITAVTVFFLAAILLGSSVQAENLAQCFEKTDMSLTEEPSQVESAERRAGFENLEVTAHLKGSAFPLPAKPRITMKSGYKPCLKWGTVKRAEDIEVYMCKMEGSKEGKYKLIASVPAKQKKVAISTAKWKRGSYRFKVCACYIKGDRKICSRFSNVIGVRVY